MADVRPYRALAFDAYGTLFDVHSVVALCEQRFPGKGAALSQLWRQKQLEYTWLRTLMERYQDFWEVTHAALGHALVALGLPRDGRVEAQLLEAYLRLRPFPEVPGALAALGPLPKVILSNGTPRMLEALVTHAGLAGAFQHLLSVDPLRAYKPLPRVYALAPERLGVPAEALLFVSSNGWDVAGARSAGLRVAWVNRARAAPEELGFPPDLVVQDLTQLVPHVLAQGAP